MQGAHWSEVVQDGQVRHLPATGDLSGMPASQFWNTTTTWAYTTYSNGGFWATASGWVLPVIARNNSALGRSLVRDAIQLARRSPAGLPDWSNAKFCCNCEGAASWTSHCMTPYPSTALLRGVDNYGSSAAAVYAAAKQLLLPVTDPWLSPAAAPTPALADTKSPLPLHVRASAALASRLPSSVTSTALVTSPRTAAEAAGDIDLEWLTEYGTMYQAEARECTGCTNCVQPPYNGCFFPPAADPGRPAAYSELWTRDFEYTLEYLYPLFDEIRCG